MSTLGHPPSGAPRRRRGPVALLLVTLLVLGPLVELWVLIQVGQVVGAWNTLVLLLLTAVLGGWLVKREGGRAWTALTSALSSGRTPTRELADAALVLLGGALMIAPGFVSDVVGLLLVLPLTRPVARAALTALAARRLMAGVTVPGPRHETTGQPHGDVVTGEVIDEPPERGGRPE